MTCSLPTPPRRPLSLRPRVSTAALLAAACLTTPATTARALEAYFSFTGDFNTPGDGLGLVFDLSRTVTNAENLRIQTFASSGGTNAAGNPIADGPGDAGLELFTSGGTPIAADDGSGGGLDARIDFTTGDAPLPAALPAAGYFVNLFDEGGLAAPFAADLIGPADAFTLRQPFTTGPDTATLSSLTFGTTGAGPAAATFSNGGDLAIAAVGLRSGAVLNHTAGVLQVDALNLVGGGLNVQNGGGLVAGALDLSAGVVTVTGFGTTLTQSGAAPLTVGDTGPGGSGILNVDDDAVFNSGTGDAVIRATGTLKVTLGGRFNAGGQLINRGLVTGGSDGIDPEIATTNGFVNEATLRPETFDGFSALTLGGGFTQTPSGALEIRRVPDEELLEAVIVRTGDTAIAGALRFTAADPAAEFGVIPMYEARSRNVNAVLLNDAGTLTGTFRTVEGHLLGDHTALAVTYDASDVFYTRARVGDANLDGNVSGADANVWRANFGAAGTGNWSTADWNGDGNVSGADLNLWRQNFGVASGALQADDTSLSLMEAAAVTTGDGTADFTYNPETGELAVDPDGQSVWSLNVATLAEASNVNLPPQWGFAEFTGEIEWSDRFAGAFPLDARFALGTLPTGLADSDFGRVLYFTTDSFDQQFGTIEVVPEPVTGVLVFAGLGTLRRRRRA